MSDKNLERILELVRANPVKFKEFSLDTQQINPEARVTSISRILENIDLPTNSTIVDIGTGYGYGAVLLNALGYNVIGIESSAEKLEEGLEYWRALGIDFSLITDASEALEGDSRLFFMHRDSRNLADFPDSSIDMATAFYISRYMLGKDGAFKDTGRILKPDSRLVITTEGHHKIPQVFRRPVVGALSHLFAPQQLSHEQIFTVQDPQVHDKFVVIYTR